MKNSSSVEAAQDSKILTLEETYNLLFSNWNDLKISDNSFIADKQKFEALKTLSNECSIITSAQLDKKYKIGQLR